MRICVFDLSSLYWRFAKGSAGRELHGAFERTLGRVHELAIGFDRVVHCCDAGPSWRTAIDPAYKANRPPKEPALVEQYWRTQEALAAQGHVVYVGREHPEHPGRCLEADDEIAAVVALATERGHQVQVVTGDKDLLALVNDERGVWCLNPERGTPCGTEGVRKAMGVDPARVTDLLALAGDASDGFKPFPGVGMESAVKLVQTYGSAPEAMIALLSGGDLAVKLTMPQLAALRAGGINALDRGFTLARLLVVPGLDFGLVEDDPASREAPPIPAPPPRPSPVPPKLVATEERPMNDTDSVLERLSEPRVAAPLALRPAEPREARNEAPTDTASVATQLRTSREIAQLVGALAAAQGEMEPASRDAENPHLRKKYADLASVWRACRVPLSRHRLAVVQVVTGGSLITRLMHASGQWIESDARLALDTATGRTPVQALGSALTYLRRYTLSGLVGVAPDDDDDGEGTRQAPLQAHRR